MDKHWCIKHQCVFFKRGNMRGYAHPVIDESGEKLLDTEGNTVWCNEGNEGKEGGYPPEVTKGETAEVVKGELKEESRMSKDDWAEKDRVTRKSIERQKSLEMAVEVAKLFGVEKASTVKIVATAKIFEAYIEGKE